MIPRLVIFDCDGVLVDTEHLSNDVLSGLVTESGWPMTAAESAALFLGMRMPDVASIIEEKIGKALREDWVLEYERQRDAAFAGGLRTIPGIESVLEAVCANTVNYCVASSGSVAKMQNTLTLTGLKPYFADHVLFTARTLPRGKPFPDVFLHAAAQMGVPPQDCIVVEDSTAGAKAAKAAGMRCLGYAATTAPALLEAEGAVCFTDMAALPNLLGLKV
ncbi:MAG: HAD family phosphatase [Rhodospirillaceae bacterium]|nr:HAD family phosphatase [Rhodospirillaceae bacterium]